MMEIGHLKHNEQVVEILREALSPRLGCNWRLDMPGNPRNIMVEFCGWQVSLLVEERMTMEQICQQIHSAFERSCNPPGFWKRLWTKIKGCFP